MAITSASQADDVGSIPITRSKSASSTGRITRREFLSLSAAGVALTGPLAPLLAADVPQLPTRSIPGTKEALPIVGLGNAVAFQEGNVELTQQLVEILLDHGGSYIDTTGRSRFTVAEVVEALRAHEQAFVATYVLDSDDATIRRDIEAVRAANGGRPLDLLLTRNVRDYMRRSEDFLRLKDEGQTRFVGVARHLKEFHEPMMSLMSAGVVDFVQVNYSMLEPEAEDRLLPMARDKGVAIVTNRPFLNGQWFSIVRGRELPEWAAEFDCETWAQFSLKFILSHPAVNCALTETSNPRHALDNVGGGLGRMPDQAMRKRMRDLVATFV